MKKSYYILFLVLLMLSCVSIKVDSTKNTTKDTTEKQTQSTMKNNHDLSMYPEAKPDYVRKVIVLDKQKNEDNYMINFQVGKVVEVDCNTHWMSGEFIQNDVKGWAYPYIEFNAGGIASTKKGCLDATTTKEFVYASSPNYRYNSKLPVVVYIPKDYQLKYSIWEKSKAYNVD